MVRRMIAAAEQTLISQAQSAVQQSFRQNLQGGTTPTFQTQIPGQSQLQPRDV